MSPVIDYIHKNTFEYIYQDNDNLRLGGFDWNLRFMWEIVPTATLKSRQYSAAPINTPVISGGLFAIDKQYFEHLGYYDEEFNIWGSENLELSFKTWMCGGTLEIIPCSHVGHVFRKQFPYKGAHESGKRNAVRLAKVIVICSLFYYISSSQSLEQKCHSFCFKIIMTKNCYALRPLAVNWRIVDIQTYEPLGFTHEFFQ